MKGGGQPKPWGRAQMVERSQGCKQSSTLRRGQMAFSSPLKALGKKWRGEQRTGAVLTDR